MLLSVLICFYGKKNKRVRVFTLCTLFFSAVSYKKENRQRLYNLLSIFILKLITVFCVKSKLNDPCCIADTGEYSKEHSHLPFYLQLCSICPNRCAVWCYCIYQHGTGLITEIILFIPVDPSCFHITFFIKEIP